MKKLTFLLLLTFCNIADASVFTELKGMEDSSGNTHLFYRIYTLLPGEFGDGFDNSIYHFDLSTNSDTAFITDHIMPQIVPFPSWGGGISVEDYEFRPDNPARYYYCGLTRGTDIGDGYIGSNNVNSFPWLLLFYGQSIINIEFSRQNDSLLYAALDYGGPENLQISADGGNSWHNNMTTNQHLLVAVSPFNDQILFSKLDTKLYKSVDGGLNYSLVDDSVIWGRAHIPPLFFNNDSVHIYAIPDYHHLFRSDDAGNSWQPVFSDSVASLKLSLDHSDGALYLAHNNEILVSHDFGESFTLHTSLNTNITGIYKKPGSQILFASTATDLLKISGASATSIKHLTTNIPDESGQDSPGNFCLEQNYPNPFNATTKIRYSLPEAGETMIKIYNLYGETIEILENKWLPAGEYQNTWHAKNLPSGIYICCFSINNRIINNRKMILLK